MQSRAVKRQAKGQCSNLRQQDWLVLPNPLFAVPSVTSHLGQQGVVDARLRLHLHAALHPQLHTAQHSTAHVMSQHSTAQHSTAQHSTAQQWG
jgi:hypothetical protein